MRRMRTIMLITMKRIVTSSGNVVPNKPSFKVCGMDVYIYVYICIYMLLFNF